MGAVNSHSLLHIALIFSNALVLWDLHIVNENRIPLKTTGVCVCTEGGGE